MSQETILIIEDEKALVEILEYNLVREGYRVFTATDGGEGLQRAQEIVPDLIVLDIMLPTLDGCSYVVCCGVILKPKTSAS